MAGKATDQATGPRPGQFPGAAERSQDRGRPGAERGPDKPPIVRPDRRRDHPIEEIPAQDGRDPHVEDVRPQGDHPPVGEEEGLGDEDDRHHQDRLARPEQNGDQDGPEQMARRPADDRKIDHLGDEEEGGGEAHQGDLAGRHPGPDDPEGPPEPRGRKGGRRNEGLRVEESVRYVHAKNLGRRPGRNGGLPPRAPYGVLRPWPYS